MDKTNVTKDLENKMIKIERTFDAPAAKLWRAYSDAEWFAKWWGPEGWETTLKEFDFVVGGRNHYCMKCVDERQGEFFGQEAWGLMEYDAIQAPRFIEYHDFFSDANGTKTNEMPTLRCTLELVEQDGKTVLINTCYASSAEEIEKLVAMGMVEGFSSSADRLEILVTSTE